jgi:hypothetical protein
MSLTIILIVLSHADVLRGIDFNFSGFDIRASIFVMAFLSGLALSIYHIFVRRIKTDFEKFLMLLFAVVLNAISGIVAGGKALENSQGFLAIFPALNFFNGILLLFLLRAHVIDESSIIESYTPFQLVCLSSVVVVFLFVLCQYALKLYWASTLSICVAHSTNFNRPGMKLIFRNIKTSNEVST